MTGNPLPGSSPVQFVIIIGAMKSGTTSLFELLAQHPQVAPSKVKEPDFFVSAQDPRTRWSDYLKLWDWDPSCHRVAMEASTAYAKHPWVPGVPERIAASPAASVRFIYVMRDPVKRIASQVRHGVYEGWGRSLDEGFTPDLIDFSRYAMQLDRYTAVFPRSDMLLLTLEDLQHNPDQVLRRTCSFLGLSDFRFTGSDKRRNTGEFYAVPPLLAGLARNPAAQWAVRHLLPGAARHRLRSLLAKVGAHKPRQLPRWELTPAEITDVRRILAADMERLKEDYGVDAAWLRRSAGVSPNGPAGTAGQS